MFFPLLAGLVNEDNDDENCCSLYTRAMIASLTFMFESKKIQPKMYEQSTQTNSSELTQMLPLNIKKMD
jgi:hypothetical protein